MATGHRFSLCIEEARGQVQGAVYVMLRWFNLQSLTEMKSQLETMHLVAGRTCGVNLKSVT